MNPCDVAKSLAANIEYGLREGYVPFEDLANLLFEMGIQCGSKSLTFLWEQDLNLLYNRIKEKQEAEAKQQQKLPEA